MILLDSDVMIDLLRQHLPAMKWFDALDDEEELLLPGYVVMELIQGCRNIITLFQDCRPSSLTKRSLNVTAWSAAICCRVSCLARKGEIVRVKSWAFLVKGSTSVRK